MRLELLDGYLKEFTKPAEAAIERRQIIRLLDLALSLLGGSSPSAADALEEARSPTARNARSHSRTHTHTHASAEHLHFRPPCDRAPHSSTSPP